MKTKTIKERESDIGEKTIPHLDSLGYTYIVYPIYRIYYILIYLVKCVAMATINFYSR